MCRALVPFAIALAVLSMAPSVRAQDDPSVLASTTHSAAHPPEFAVDGDPATRWASTQAPAPHWIEFDLGQVRPVAGLTIHWETAHASDYEIQVSTDRREWQTLLAVTGLAGGVQTHEGLNGEGRYVRILCTETTAQYQLASIWEISFTNAEANDGLMWLRARTAERRALEAEAARARLASVFEQTGVEEIVFATRKLPVDGHWYANFGYYAADSGQKLYHPGGQLLRLSLKTGEVATLIDDPEGCVRDPQLDYSGTKVLFSYMPGGTENYHLFEINVDGSGLRQLTDGDCDDIEPTYLPSGDIMFCSSRCYRWVNCWLTPVAVLYVCDADGGNVRMVSSNVEHDNTPWPLPDGRVLYMRWEYVDRSQVDYHHLWTSNPDGTEQMVYYGNLHPGTAMLDAKPIPGTDKVVAIFSPGHGATEHQGLVTIVDPGAGPDALASAQTISAASDLRDPYPLTPEVFLVARGPEIQLLDIDGTSVPIYTLPQDSVAAGLWCHEPRPIVARTRERVIPTSVDPQSPTGQLVLADVYRGRNMEGVARGEIKKLLVLESLPKPINYTGGMDPLSYGGTFTLERVVGTVPVEEDGSAFFELPALRSYFLVALDENDLSVKRMQSFLTVQPGETTSCVGCHEDRAQTTKVSGAPMATRRPPSAIEPVPEVPEVFDFPRDIQPILDKHCVGCHGYDATEEGGPRAGGVILTGDRGPMFSHSYYELTITKQVADGRNTPRSNYPPRALGSSASPLMHKVLEGHHGVSLTEHKINMIRYWIESGAAYPGTYGALGGGAIGGYYANQLTETDFAWPEAQDVGGVVDARCASCHSGGNVLPRALADERDVSFWRPDWDDPRLATARHIVFNLSRPEKSLMLLAPLARDAGGYGLCATADGPVFASADDPGYQSILALCRRGKQRLEEIGRFDMPGFRPPPPYLREMVRNGTLADLPGEDAAVDTYAIDRIYWQAQW